MASRPKVSDETMERLDKRLDRLGYRPERMDFETKVMYLLDAAEKVPTDSPGVGATARDTHASW